MTHYRAGADIGGTFTDIVLLGDDGTVFVEKVPSTPDDYGRAVTEGLCRRGEESNFGGEAITEISHGFTVAANAILEGKGKKTALITTDGFRDVLEIARIRTPRLYDLYYRKPPVLVERRLRFEVKERLNFRGEVLTPLDMDTVETAVDAILEEGVKSVAIVLIHAYANPQHEEQIADYIRRRAPHISLSVSSEILPEMREYERTCTTVINGYIRPVVETYLTQLGTNLKQFGIDVPLTIMQSNGGLAALETATTKPIYCIESGPAAGVVGAYHIGKRLGIDQLMTFDMGGTTAKASIIEDGDILRTQECEVGGGMSAGHRLLKGSGYILRVPAIDIAEVSAGGGSIAWVDKGGSLQVGPESAGAVPGPVCYEKGGEKPTVTDANVTLGFLNPECLLGGEFSINAGKAGKALAEKIGKPLGLSEIEAAHGVHLLANSNMGRALRSVSSERGRDPRKFALMAFGGGRPIHGAGISEMLGIMRIIVPPSPGVFSAFGLLFADVEHHFVQTHFKSFADLDIEELNRVLQSLWQDGRNLLSLEGFPNSRHDIVTQIDMKYVGQTSELTVNMPSHRFDHGSLKEIAEAFEQEHERNFGYRGDTPHQLVSLRVIARGIASQSRVPDRIRLQSQRPTSDAKDRKVFFGSQLGWVESPVIDRPALNRNSSKGPLVIEEYDSTTIVPPGWSAWLDDLKNIVIEKMKMNASLENTGVGAALLIRS